MHTEYILTEGLFFVGNGKVAMGGSGADIVQLFAPCYSMPGIMSLRASDQSIVALNHRIRGSACYVTTLCAQGKEIGTLTDFSHPTLPVFIRRFSLVQPIDFLLESPFVPIDISAVFDGAKARLFEIPEGTVVFSQSKTDKDAYCSLLLSDSCTVNGRQITFPAGDSHLIFVGGDFGACGTDSYACCMDLSAQILGADLDAIKRDFFAHWQDILSQIRVDDSVLGADFNVRELIEAVAVALITQTADQGGVIAGSFYHLAYGRDMYGVFRGYMALGLHEYAKRMICYMTDVFRQKGYMPNASGLGMSCSHRHENDEVEQTGYYLLELLEYIRATGDVSFLAERMDYARYLLSAQQQHLCDGMIPFNGDETYIAGGIFPRSGIDHGSMEATALYITSALALLEICETHGLMTHDNVTAHRAPALKAAMLFSENFISENTVYINNPGRVQHAQIPVYRHGVCLGCSRMTNLLRDAKDAFLCSGCFGKITVPPCTERYSLDCAIWMSVFAGSTLLPAQLIRTAIEASVARIRQSEYGKHNPDNTVGYEYGVILYALAKYVPAEQLGAYADLLRELLDDRVRGSVWTEYYRAGLPADASCPYRPWESAINLCGIMAYLQALDN